MKIYILTFCLIVSLSSLAQKPGLEESYRFKQTPKISLEALRIPHSAGKNVLIEAPTENQKKANKNRGPSAVDENGNRNIISVSGACTQQNGGIVSPGDPAYDSCLDGSVYVKKVILTDPTQSILMNLNLDGLNFNPFN